MLAHGGVPALVGLLRSDDGRAREEAAYALKTLTWSHGKCKVAVHRTSGLPVLIELVATVRARPRRLRALSVLHVNRCCMAVLYRRTWRLTAENGGFWPGQAPTEALALHALGALANLAVGTGLGRITASHDRASASHRMREESGDRSF